MYDVRSVKKTSDYQVLLMDKPYDLMSVKEVKKIYTDLLELKISGYLAEYEYGALPADSTDLIGTHVMILDQNSRILMAFKSISFKRCQSFGLPFPGLSLASLKPELEQEVKPLCSTDISYDSSWTIHPSLRAGANQLVLLEIMAALLVFLHQDSRFPEEGIIAGVKRFKTDAFFRKMGAQSLASGELFPHPLLHGEPCSLLHWGGPSKTALRLAEKHEGLWSNRLEYIKSDLPIPKIA